MPVREAKKHEGNNKFSQSTLYYSNTQKKEEILFYYFMALLLLQACELGELGRVQDLLLDESIYRNLRVCYYL